MSIDRFKVGPRLSAAVKHGDTIYVAGTVADDTKLDAKGQTEQILRKIDDALKHFGSHKSKLVWANVWVSDIRHYDGMNEREIAEALDISVGSVRTHTKRGLAALERRLRGRQ